MTLFCTKPAPRPKGRALKRGAAHDCPPPAPPASQPLQPRQSLRQSQALRGWGWCFFAALAPLGTGCVTPYEASMRVDVAAPMRAAVGPLEARAAAPTGSLAGYIALALENNPDIQVAFKRWEAAVYRISSFRRLPAPRLGFMYFLKSVETRVGAQRARLSLQQAFPWPSKLTAAADAASLRARAAQRRFEAQALTVAQQVATAYWKLWQIRRTRAIHQKHLEVLRALSESVRARLSAGAAMLADLQQVNLTAARLDDSIRGMDEAEYVAEARLRAALGGNHREALPTSKAPDEVALPSENTDALLRLLQAHPLTRSFKLRAQAAQSSARAEAAARFPDFALGAEWILTDETPVPGIADAGKDAVMLGATITLPLWQHSYADSVAAARAEAQAAVAERQAHLSRATAACASSLSHVRDAVRRVELYRGTLVPQAESSYDALLGAYTVGRGTVAQILLAQQDVLELHVKLESARADYARAWARLEALLGRQLAREKT